MQGTVSEPLRQVGCSCKNSEKTVIFEFVGVLDLIDKTNMNLKLKILADSLEEFGYPFIYIYIERERERQRE